MSNSSNKKYHFRPLSELNLIDDFLFNTLSSIEGVNTEFYSLLLPVILGKRLRILDVVPQQMIPGVDTDLHGIRIDAHVEAVAEGEPADSTPVIYDFEPGTRVSDRGFLPRRNRFYSDLIDVQKLRSGEDYSSIPDLVIINILSYDPFGMGELWYEAGCRLITHPDVPYQDGVRHIYLYCKGALNPNVLHQVGVQDGEALKNVLQYFCNSTEENVTDDNVRRLNDLVARVKARKEVSKQYMITLFRDQSIRDEARSEAWNEARDETLRRLNKLILLLIESNRYDDLKRAAEDPDFQEQLFKELNIVP